MAERSPLPFLAIQRDHYTGQRDLLQSAAAGFTDRSAGSDDIVNQ